MKVTKDTIDEEIYPVSVIRACDAEDDFDLDYYRTLGYRGAVSPHCGEAHIVRYNVVNYVRAVDDDDLISFENEIDLQMFCNTCREWVEDLLLVDPNIAYPVSVLIQKGYKVDWASEGKPVFKVLIDSELDEADFAGYSDARITFDDDDKDLLNDLIKLEPPSMWEFDIDRSIEGDRIISVDLILKDRTLEEFGIYSKKALVKRIKNLNEWVEKIPERSKDKK